MLVADPRTAAAWRRFRQEFADAGPERRREMLRERANQSRTTDLHMIGRAGLGHVGGDMSVLDILTTLFFGVLRVDPEKPDWADRDRLVLSKGHTAGALYATLAASGFFAEAELETFAGPLSALNGHPNRVKVPGVETNTGPLGHGLPVSVGMAVAAKLSSSSRHVYVVLGDGELQEGSNWEAAMTAGHRRLDNLTAIVDRNRLQQGARTEETNTLDPLDDKFRAFGWDVLEIDGHDHLSLYDAFTAARGERPTCVIANTTKGRGVSFMEDRVEWHHKVPSAEQIVTAAAELAR
ncbi:transketolase [Paractinoplanes abujensis]|uniref:Transketolase n=1 Tax=Paractinoplanes abujensis TaxID=882441 RepID=A0A7W7CPI1_9ACTN|nr:transketolase [Actinoplanes abujensis]MBB4692342.1 transketolase [Actinoplanes abujensis]GID24180.1 transketolase [Actinoplanes abujensis]